MKKKFKTLKELRDARAEVIENFDALQLKVSEAENGADVLTEDEQKEMRSFSSTMAEFIAAEELLNSAATRAMQKAGTPLSVVPGVGADISEKEIRDFTKMDLGKALADLSMYGEVRGLESEVDDYARRDAASKNWELQPGGFAMPAELGKMEHKSEKRGQTATGQTTNPGDQGGKLVATEIAPFIDDFWESSWVGQVGATRFSNLQGNPVFPKVITKPTIQELTEVQAMTDDEILWGDLNMTPNRRGNSIPISRLLMHQASIDTRAFVLRKLRQGMTRKLNTDARLTLAAIAALGDLGTDGGGLTWDNIVALETAIAGEDADQGRLKYLTNAKVRGLLKTTKKDAGSGIFLMDGKNNELNGYDTVISNLMSSTLEKGSSGAVCSEMFFGNWEDLYVGLWDGMVFDVERIPKSDKSEFTVNAYWDTVIARTESFTKYSDILTA